MDTSDPDIVFDDQGYCNHCNNYFSKISLRTYRGRQSDEELLQLIRQIKNKGKGKKYDCVLGVSGGIDSSYAAYILKQHDVRTLLVHMDNGWNSDISVKNILYLADKLGFDYESYVLNWEEFRELQLAFLKASVPEIETPTDIAIPAALHRVASKYSIKYIISGGNYVTEGILPKTWHYNAKDQKYLKHIYRTYGHNGLKKFPLFGWKKELYYKLFLGMRMIYLLNYVNYNKENAIQILENELGWKNYGGKHYESKYTGFVQSYILPVKFNIDYRRATFSTRICAGEMNREEAIKILEQPSYNSEKIAEEKEYICKKLQIPVNDFDLMMQQTPGWYRDFPNAEKKLEFIYKIYRTLYGKPDYR